MTLDELLLQKLAEWRPDKGRHSLNLRDEASGWKVTLAADCSDQVGCRVWELSLRRDKNNNDLRAWANSLRRRPTARHGALIYLGHDPPQAAALQAAPARARRGETLHYYEILLHGRGEVQVRRYQATRDGTKRREQIAFALTHEAV